MVLHDFQEPVKVLSNANQMLKPSGIIANLDWKKIQTPFGPPMLIRFSEEYASDLIMQAGLKLREIKEAGQYHYLITAGH